MKLSLTITEINPDELPALISKLNGNADSAPVPVPSAPAVTGGPVPAPYIPPVGTTLPVTPAAPVAQAPVAAAPVAGGEQLDANGLPWDERIHAGTKTMTEKGVWKKRKGVQEPQIREVETELRARMAASPAVAAAPMEVAHPQVGAVPVMVNPAEMFGGQPGATSAPLPSPAPAVDPRVVVRPQPVAAAPMAAPQPQMPAPQPQGPVQDFPTLMNIIQQLFNNQVIDPTYMANLNGRLGAAAITDISQDPNRIAQAFAMLRADGKIQ